MEANPYQSPVFDESLRASSVPFKLAAVVCWFLAAVPWLFLSTIRNADDWVDLWESSTEMGPFHWAIVILLLLVLPSSGLCLLGIAGWRRWWWPALVGTLACMAAIGGIFAVWMFNL